MKVPTDYYEAEVRDGYYVSSEMKRCWAATIETLLEIEKVCRKYRLNYYADYGTLIGAVRHGGFIPWDDDLDICMKREDYMIFLSVAERELPEEFKVLSCYNNSEYRNFLTRVTNNSFICMQHDFLKKNHDFPFSVGVDIFPIDYVCEDDDTENIRSLIEEAQDIAYGIDDKPLFLHELGKEGLRIAKLLADCGTTIQEGKPIRQQLLILLDRLMAVYKEGESDKIAHMYFWAMYKNHIYPKECYSNSIRLPFEYITIPVPIGYDYLLKSDYGPNYMTPVKGGGMHGYPVYYNQRIVMFDVLGKYYYRDYHFDKTDLIHNKTDNRQKEVKDIVFLPFKAQYWDTMENEWRKAIADPSNKVYVIPIPFYRKGNMRTDEELCYEGDKFPDYLNIIGFDEYDFETRRPKQIYISNPYDEYNEGLTVHPRFYSDRMKSVCDELIYIPYFNVDDFAATDDRSVIMSKYYIRMPGVTRADQVIVQSEKLRQRYIEELTDFAGSETENIWKEQIVVSDNIVSDDIVGLYEDEVPDDWWSYLLTDTGEGKKVILYHLNVGNMILFKDTYLKKIGRTIKTFEEQADKIAVLWLEDEMTSVILENYYPELWNQYLNILNEYMEKRIGIYECSDETYKAVRIADAYYGDRCPVMYKVRELKKPIMIQNIDV